MVALPFSACEVIRNSEEMPDVGMDFVLNGIADSLVSRIRPCHVLY